MDCDWKPVIEQGNQVLKGRDVSHSFSAMQDLQKRKINICICVPGLLEKITVDIQQTYALVIQVA